MFTMTDSTMYSCVMIPPKRIVSGANPWSDREPGNASEVRRRHPRSLPHEGHLPNTPMFRYPQLSGHLLSSSL